jgi:hypothetical protein
MNPATSGDDSGLTRRSEEPTVFTTLPRSDSLDAELRDQRHRLAGLVQARRTKFRVPRRRSLKLPVQRPRPTIVQ